MFSLTITSSRDLRYGNLKLHINQVQNYIMEFIIAFLAIRNKIAVIIINKLFFSFYQNLKTFVLKTISFYNSLVFFYVSMYCYLEYCKK